MTSSADASPFDSGSAYAQDTPAAMKHCGKRLAFAAAGILLAGVVSGAQTDAPSAARYPTKPIRALVGFVPGGATDIMARLLGQKLTEAFGRQFIVDNRAGGGGVIAATMAKDAPPDGYTIFFGTISTLATNVAISPQLPYEPLRDFAPITMTSYNPYFLAVHPAPVASWPEAPPIAQAAGLPGFEATSWQGMVAPAKTPKAIVARLYGEFVKALNSPEVRTKLAAESSEAGGMPPDEFAQYIAKEIAKWKRVVKEANIKVE